MFLQYTRAVDGRRHTCSTWKITKYIQGWSSKSKCICNLMKCLLSGESYELTQVKAFDMRWSIIILSMAVQ